MRETNFVLFDVQERFTDLKLEKVNTALHWSQLISCKLNAVLQKWQLQKIALVASLMQPGLREEGTSGSEMPVTPSSHSHLLLLHLCRLNTCRDITRGNPPQSSEHGNQAVGKKLLRFWKRRRK